jgi:tetratricopeptide (TPR) repeat protein
MKAPWVVRLISGVCFLALLPATGHALTAAQVFDKVKDTVVVVKTLGAQGKVKLQGSGVLLPSGRVATNCHLVGGGTSYLVGRGKELISATLYAEDDDKNICLLDAKGIQGKPAHLGKAASLKVGDQVYAVGAPQGLELSLSDGIVTQLRGGPPPLIQTTAALSPGSSGGGLFDGEGRLVGLTVFYLEDAQNLTFAMPAEWIGEVKPGRTPAAEGTGHTEWLKRAIVLETTEDWQGLLEWCLKWTKREPENANVWFSLGTAYGHLNLYNDAVEALRQATRIDPKDAKAWYNLGTAYGHLNLYNDAVEALRRATRIDPKDAKAWDNLGNAYGHLDRYNDAIEGYRQAIRIDPVHAAAWNNLGIAYRHLDRYNDAIEGYRQAIRIDPEDATVWFNLGIAYRHLDRYNDAIEGYRQAIRIDPEYAKAWYNLGIAYFLSGNRTEALSALRELRRLDPTQADKLFSLIGPR